MYKYFWPLLGILVCIGSLLTPIALLKDKAERKKHTKKKNTKVFLQRIDSFSKSLIYINMVVLIVSFIWGFILYTLNGFTPDIIITEASECWQKTFPIYLLTKSVENVSKGVCKLKGGMDDGIYSERDCVDNSSDRFGGAGEDNRSTC